MNDRGLVQDIFVEMVMFKSWNKKKGRFFWARIDSTFIIKFLIIFTCQGVGRKTLFEPRQELVMSVVTRMKESNRRTRTKARMMYKNRATASRRTTGLTC
jgi:hypothetical protein